MGNLTRAQRQILEELNRRAKRQAKAADPREQLRRSRIRVAFIVVLSWAILSSVSLLVVWMVTR